MYRGPAFPCEHLVKVEMMVKHFVPAGKARKTLIWSLNTESWIQLGNHVCIIPNLYHKESQRTHITPAISRV